MHLVSVTLQGFKSFPERTEIRFHPGVTAIVGPNGSGKSNVTDAIRWVLGEQSAKTLRGSKMEDIIFAGTELRRPLSFAEVILKLDNNDYSLPIDASEVEVSRRLYRSGESEYVINRQQCRLRDIVELFMDTGIGREGYSIVGQGRIDEVLSSKSEDRRRIFDEAAGISRFKSRRDEASRKLQATEVEQQRAEDLLIEINRQLRPLKKQAEQAKTYIRLQTEFQELDLALIYREMDILERELHEYSEQETVYAADFEAGAETEAQLNEAIHNGTLKLNELERLEETNLQTRDAAILKLRDHNGQIELLQARFEQMREQFTSRQARVEHARERLDQLKSEEQAQADTLRSIRSRIEANEQALKVQKESTDGALNARQRLLTEVTEAESLLLSTKEELQDRRHQLRLLEQEAGQSARYEEQLAREMAQMAETLAAAENKNRTATQHSKINSERRTALQTRIEEYRALTRDLQEKLRSAESRVQRAINNEQQRVYRLNTLESLRQNYEGYHESVRRLLSRVHDETLLARIYGPLGDLITVEEGYETAIDVALGAAIQNVVVEDSGTAGSLIRLLKSERLGRVTFLPLANLSTSSLNRDLQAQAERSSGYIGVASELVSYDPAIAAAVQNTLARTVIMRDLDSANRLASDSRYRLRIVTLEGEIIMPGGALTGGSRRQRQSLLSRPREIEELQAQEQVIAEELTAAEKLSQELSERSNTLSKDTEEAQSEYSILEQEKARLEAELAQARAEQERVSVRFTQLEDEASGVIRQKEETAADSREVELSIEKLTELQDELVPCISQLNDEYRRAELTLEEEQSALQTLRSNQSELSAEIKAAQQLADHFAREHTQQLDILTSFEQEQSEGSEATDRLAREINDLEAKTQVLEQELASANQKRENAQILRRAAADNLDSARARLTEARDNRQRLELERTRLLARRDNRQDKLDSVRNRLWEEYELTFADREAWHQEDLKEQSARKRVSELREEIRTLGTVNVNAVEEQRELDERREFIEKQIADISASRDELDKLIRQITQAMKDSFAESFRFIRKEFQVVFAELFNGGQADIVLEDENDILGSGIDIKASPPGKKLQNMLLLSGGERCLSAIALIFALQRLRPAPFCILDEVEAALDDSNIFRFNDYVRSQSQDIQFILVTHRKGTMEAADRLYGVTMQEQGVSRILSVQLT